MEQRSNKQTNENKIYKKKFCLIKSEMVNPKNKETKHIKDRALVMTRHARHFDR